MLQSVVTLTISGDHTAVKHSTSFQAASPVPGISDSNSRRPRYKKYSVQLTKGITRKRSASHPSNLRRNQAIVKQGRTFFTTVSSLNPPLYLRLALVVYVKIGTSHAGADLEARERVAQDQVEGVGFDIIGRQVLGEV